MKTDIVEDIMEEEEKAKCPDCGKDYLKKTGYCLSCKKKVKEGDETPEGEEEKELEEKEQDGTDEKVDIEESDSTTSNKSDLLERIENFLGEDKLVEGSSNWDRKIETIENALGYEQGIDAWVRAVSVDDAKDHIEATAGEWDVDIPKIRDKNSLWQAIENMQNSMGEEELFKDLYYYMSDSVARYIIDGIIGDHDLEESSTKKKVKEAKNDSIKFYTKNADQGTLEMFSQSITGNLGKNGIEGKDAVKYIQALIKNLKSEMDFHKRGM